MNPSVLQQRRYKRISLTALIDVVFILLMFFMLTTGFSHWQSLDLPASAASQSAESEPPILLLIGKRGELRLLNQALSSALSMADVLQSINDDRALVVSAHEDTQVSDIVKVMAALNEAKRAFTLGQPYSTDLEAR